MVSIRRHALNPRACPAPPPRLLSVVTHCSLYKRRRPNGTSADSSQRIVGSANEQRRAWKVCAAATAGCSPRAWVRHSVYIYIVCNIIDNFDIIYTLPYTLCQFQSSLNIHALMHLIADTHSTQARDIYPGAGRIASKLNTSALCVIVGNDNFRRSLV